MKINLLDISEDGYEFAFKMGEDKLMDEQVVQRVEELKNYSFKIFLQKAGDIYTATGEYILEKNDECSLCAEDISLPVKQKFAEYLMNEKKGDQKGHAPHNGLNVESEQEVTFVRDFEFDIGDFMAELIAIAVPNYPKCLDTKACTERQLENKKYLESQSETGHPAFSVLSKLKKAVRTEVKFVC